MKIPISEHFHSIQGEGTWVGTPMHFIRTAGCSVGKRMEYGDSVEVDSLAEGERLLQLGKTSPTLPTGKRAWLCRTWDGRPFWCDTDFNKREEPEISDLINDTWERHICLTGGEPLIHRSEVNELIGQARERSITVHIETSGTILPPPDAWITMSPKIGCDTDFFEYANEIKLLISEGFDDKLLPPQFDDLDIPVFLSPINKVSPVEEVAIHRVESAANLELCMKILKRNPRWRLSVQLHKYLNLR